MNSALYALRLTALKDAKALTAEIFKDLAMPGEVTTATGVFGTSTTKAATDFYGDMVMRYAEWLIADITPEETPKTVLNLKGTFSAAEVDNYTMNILFNGGAQSETTSIKITPLDEDGKPNGPTRDLDPSKDKVAIAEVIDESNLKHVGHDEALDGYFSGCERCKWFRANEEGRVFFVKNGDLMMDSDDGLVMKQEVLMKGLVDDGPEEWDEPDPNACKNPQCFREHSADTQCTIVERRENSEPELFDHENGDCINGRCMYLHGKNEEHEWPMTRKGEKNEGKAFDESSGRNV